MVCRCVLLAEGKAHLNVLGFMLLVKFFRVVDLVLDGLPEVKLDHLTLHKIYSHVCHHDVGAEGSCLIEFKPHYFGAKIQKQTDFQRSVDQLDTLELFLKVLSDDLVGGLIEF